MKLKINPDIQLRILSCALCGEWVSTGADSCRGFGKEAIDHVADCHSFDLATAREAGEEEEFWEGSFYLYTERHFSASADFASGVVPGSVDDYSCDCSVPGCPYHRIDNPTYPALPPTEGA